MIYILENVLPIGLATLAGLLFGFLWYRSLGITSDARPLTTGFAVTAFVAEFWLASILAGALILAPPQAARWTMTIATPIVIWLGFIVPALVVTLARRGISIAAIAKETGHWVGVMVIQAAVLQSVGLTAPQAMPS
ncbi:DUF1761 domain-containing protein [Aureimonas psammosilenae]|uniref:DUF1761 domain-containing protein n=1 Tax=Aureimonas psammosilenae TaxID=2495496 RepID=UPI0012611A64|nr:DUF1761 domain-containing protein [Aureimonas psammosilenae]